MLTFMENIKTEYPGAIELNFGTKWLTFKNPIQRIEEEKEFYERLKLEDKEYVLKYKEISRKIKEVAEYM